MGWLGFSAYRKKRAAATETDTSITATDLSANSAFSSTTIAPPPGEQEVSQFSSTGLGMAAHQESVDPVVEADTFLAFGRDAQAEEILLEALNTDPQRQAVHLKLLDIYSGRKNVSQFESVAKALHVLTGGSGAGWEKAAAMGAALDPGNSLYGPAPSVAKEAAPAGPADMGATTILHSATIVAAQEALPSAEAVRAAEEAAALDFDLDIGTTDAAAAAGAAPVAEPEAAGLDFDLDLGTPDAAPSPESKPKAEETSEIAALDIDFEMPTPQPAAPALDFPVAAQTPAEAPKAPAVAAADSTSIVFDFDLEAPDSAAPAPLPEASGELPALAAGGLDLADISLDLETPAVASEAAPDLPAGDVPDNPEVATKIELAMAYEEMGDRDGARELFQEALAEGSPAQQKVVRAKLDSLG